MKEKRRKRERERERRERSRGAMTVPVPVQAQAQAQAQAGQPVGETQTQTQTQTHQHQSLYEVYERAVRRHLQDEGGQGEEEEEGSSSINTSQPTTWSAPSSSSCVVVLHSAATLVVFDAHVGDLVFFSKLDDYSKPTRIVHSSPGDPFVRVHGGKDVLVALSTSGLGSLMDKEGQVQTTFSSTNDLRLVPEDIVFLLPCATSHAGEILVIKRDAAVEIHRLGAAKPSKKVVKANKFHSNVTHASYNEAKNIICLVGGDATQNALETVSVWRFKSDQLHSLESRPFAHFGLGQNKFQRYVLTPLDFLRSSLKSRQSGNEAQSSWKVALSPLAERIAVKSPTGMHLFEIAEEAIKPMDTAGLLGSCCQSLHECEECLWWSENRLLCNVGSSKLLVLQTKDRNVLFEHSFAKKGSFNLYFLNNAKAMILKIAESKQEVGWQLVCVAHRSPSEMLHSYLAKSKFDEAKQIAKMFQLDAGIVHKRQWLQSQATVENIESILFKVEDKAWVIEQCIGSIGNDFQAQKYLLSHGLEQVSMMLVSDKYDEKEKRELIRAKVKILRHVDCLETSLALFNQTYFVEVYSEVRNHNLASMACLYAQTGNVDSLQILFHHHPCFLLPNILQILSCFPESMDMSLYKSVFDHISITNVSTFRQDDPCETLEELAKTGIIEALEKGDSTLLCKITDNVYSRSKACQKPSMETVRAWIPARLVEIVNSGYFSNARAFIDIISSLLQPAISPDVSTSFEAVLGFMTAMEMGLTRWDMDSRHFLKADRLSKLRILLEMSTNKTIERDMKAVVLPFFINKVASHDFDKQSLILQFVEEEFDDRPVWSINFLSDLCLSIADDLKIDIVPFAQKTIDILKLKPNMGDWDIISGSLSKLLNSLMQEGNQSILTSIKTLCDRVQSVRLLEKYGLKLDIALLEEYSKDNRHERTLLRKLLSKAAQLRERSDEMWDHLWDDACMVCDLIYKTSNYEQILSEFCRVLLQTGKFLTAERFLDGKDGVQLPQSTVEKVVLAAGKELFYGAKSFSSAEVSKAKQCFLTVPESRIIRKELDYISSLENVEQFGLALRPCDLKHISEKADIFDMILKHDPTSYTNVSGLIQFANSLNLSSKEDHLQVKLKLARSGIEAGDIGFALDFVNLFMEENFVPAADFVVHVIKAIHFEGVENTFLAEMISFAICYCPEKELNFLVGKLKLCMKSEYQTTSAGSILREHEFWVTKACSALSALLEFEDLQVLLDYVEDVVSVIDNNVHVERILATLLSAFAVKAGVLSPEFQADASSATGQAGMRVLFEKLKAQESVNAAAVATLMKWFELLWKAAKMIHYCSTFRVGSYVVGSVAQKQDALLDAVEVITRGDECLIEQSLPVILDCSEGCIAKVEILIVQLVTNIFEYRKCNWSLSSSLSASISTLDLAPGGLTHICDKSITDVYENLSGADTFTILYLFNILEVCVSLSNQTLIGQLEGYNIEDVRILKHVLALIVWIEKEIDFKNLISSEESCVAEMKKWISFSNVNGFASICECLYKTSLWQDYSGFISTSKVYLYQMQKDLYCTDYSQEELIDIVSQSFHKLDARDIQDLVGQLTCSHDKQARDKEFGMPADTRLRVLEVAFDVAKKGGDQQMVSSFSSIIVNEKALQSMDEILNLTPEHRALLDKSDCTEDLYNSLGILAEEGVDLCVLIFAASVYGILDANYTSLQDMIIRKIRLALDAAEWNSEKGIVPVTRLVRCLEAREESCLNQLELSNLAEFIDKLRTLVWNEIQSHIKEHEYGDSPSVQPFVLLLSEEFASWKDWSQPDDEGFDHIVLLCQSNEILEQLWGDGPQSSKDDFKSIESLEKCFERLLLNAGKREHVKALHNLLICWEENWKPRADTAQLAHCHLDLFTKSLEIRTDYALKILFHMERENHPTIIHEDKCENFFQHLMDRIECETDADNPSNLLSLVFFKSALLVPHGGIHCSALSILEDMIDSVVLDDDLIGLLACRGLLPDLSRSDALVDSTVSVLGSIGEGEMDGERETIKALVTSKLVRELCLLQKYEKASELVIKFLRIHRTMVTADMHHWIIDKYRKKAETTACTAITICDKNFSI